ncbi:MAG: hypothetical protein RI907_1177 [Pseudomonadota bacterium]|jgi:uncharacterized protein YfaT (DUF1175 family)
MAPLTANLVSPAAAGRRAWLGQACTWAATAGLGVAATAGATPPTLVPAPRLTERLDAAQTAAFRAWFVAIVNDQVRRPSPRWQHRDCAGLVRFAVAEALRPHDARWRHAMGWSARQLPPPDVAWRADQAEVSQTLGRRWATASGERSAFASAIALVQLNARLVGRDRTAAQPGDLLFFDQGDDQHLMVWTGRAVAYHTGAAPRPDDNGLRWQRWEKLLTWPDTRWRPRADNPNFAGIYRLAFLADAT